jgi:peptidoglycan/xylan/chitin deacetylase (PgdA/CDA1 family)
MPLTPGRSAGLTISNRILTLVSRLFEPVYAGRGQILMLHRITPNLPRRVPGQAGLEVTPGQLEETIRFFASLSYDFISPDQLPAYLEQPHGKTKFVMFTFDDGYRDNLEVAYPIFKQYGVPFTIYLAASFPERKAVLWWYLLDDLILSHEHLEVTIDDEEQHFDCSSLEGKKNASQYLRRRIKYADAGEYESIIHNVFNPYGVDLHQKTGELALTWEEITRLSKDPLVTIGSHSMNHYTLKKLPEETALDEILRSKHIIQEHIQKPVEHFAYPYGERNEAGEREFRLVKECGFKTAVTTRFNNVFPGYRHYLERLPRYDLPSFHTSAQLLQAINGLTTCRRNRFKRMVIQ